MSNYFDISKSTTIFDLSKTKNMTTTYKVYSAKEQGCYSKDELLYTLTEAQYNREYKYCELEKIVSDGTKRIYIKKETC